MTPMSICKAIKTITPAGSAYYALLACSVVLAFGSALTLPFGFTDDYSMLFHQQAGWGQSTIDWYIASGRPLLGYMNFWLLESIDYIEDLVILRAFGLLLLIVLGWMVLNILLKHGVPIHEASMLAIACVLSPSAAIYAGWAIASVSMSAGILSVLAAAMAERAWNGFVGWKQADRRIIILLLSGGSSVVLIVFALMIYQPLAPVFLFVCVLGVFFGRRNYRGLQYIIFYLAVYLIAMMLYYLVFKYALLPNLPDQGDYTAAVQRGSIDLSPFRIAKALMVETVPTILGGWEYFKGGVRPSSLPWGVRWVSTLPIVCLLIPLALWHVVSGLGKKLSVRLGGIIALSVIWIISLLPMLILADHYMPIRTLFFSYAVIPVLLYVAFKRLTDHRPWPSWVTFGAVILMTSQSAACFWDGFVRIQNREYTLIRQAMLSSNPRPSELLFIRPSLGFSPDHQMPTVHEYYFFSTHADWVPEAMANLIWNQHEGIKGGHQQRDRLHYTRVHRVWSGELNPALGARIVDAQAILCGVPGDLKSLVN